MSAARDRRLPLTRPPLRGAPQRRIVAVVNPTKRRSEQAVAALHRAVADTHPHAELSVLSTTAVDTGRAQGRAAVEAGADLVIALGGDGTVRAVAAALADTGVDLGIVALGTANLVARNLGVYSPKLPLAVDHALRGPTAALDLGQAAMVTDGVEHTQVFLVVAGIGRDAEAISRVRRWLKSHAGWLAYFEAGARQSWRRPLPMDLVIDDEPPVTVAAWSILAGNFGRIPGGLDVFPGAVADDGALETLITSPRHPLHWAQIGLGGLTRRHNRTKGLHYRRATSLQITPAEPCAVQLDGDVELAVDQLTVQIRPGALRVRLARTSTQHISTHPDHNPNGRP